MSDTHFDTIEPLFKKGGLEFASMVSHNLIDKLMGEYTCFTCHDPMKDHNSCRKKACYVQLLRNRKR